MLRGIATAVLDGLLVFRVLVAAPFCWLLRDGLGPDAVDSHGLHAVARFGLTFYWGPVLAVLLGLRLRPVVLLRLGRRSAESGKRPGRSEGGHAWRG